MIAYESNTSFYVTLQSNASLDVFSNNNPSRFLNKLHSIIQCSPQQRWRVGLAEIHVPTTSYNVIHGQNKITWREEIKDRIAIRTRRVTPGYYHTIAQLVRQINSADSPFTLTINSELQTIEVSVESNVTSLHFSPILALQLGFDPNRNIVKQIHSDKVPSLTIGYPQQVFVYTDLVDFQFVGDVKAPLLRIASAPLNQYGRMQTIPFNPIHYLPLSKFTFDTIKIILRDGSGRMLPFAFGTCSVKLHFQREDNDM